jgi:hypothetical protein
VPKLAHAFSLAIRRVRWGGDAVANAVRCAISLLVRAASSRERFVVSPFLP